MLICNNGKVNKSGTNQFDTTKFIEKARILKRRIDIDLEYLPQESHKTCFIFWWQIYVSIIEQYCSPFTLVQVRSSYSIVK